MNISASPAAFSIPTRAFVCIAAVMAFSLASSRAATEPLDQASPDPAYFETAVLPVITQRCFPCHSHEHAIKGGLALDTRTGLEQGGVGGPVVVPFEPERSRLIRAVLYTDKDLRMPPDGQLSREETAVLVSWVQQGALDPRAAVQAPAEAGDSGWDTVYRERLGWWSLQPRKIPIPPPIEDTAWPRNDLDRFILARLEGSNLAPAPEAEPIALARRLHFALTGLPPKPDDLKRFVTDDAPEAYEHLVDSLLDSPHFGERWARHWMDVVHYADTHGYEWDVPAKNAWMYRDYLVRAFNRDVSFQQLILEQIAGDLIPPRIDLETGINEAMIGPMAMRLGERRHGDNADAEGVTQEAVANIIDTLSKGFLATTVACAQCHDHKLDAIGQRDYYALAGVLESSRWMVRSVEVEDPNLGVIEMLREVKREIREELGSLWAGAHTDLFQLLLAQATDAAHTQQAPPAESVSSAPFSPFPASLPELWTRFNEYLGAGVAFDTAWRDLAAAFETEREQRSVENGQYLTLIADFTQEVLPEGWRVDGFGMKHGRAHDGDFAVADEGDAALLHLLPAGRWSHLWSQRLAGAVRSPLFSQDPPPHISVGYAAGRHAAQSINVDNSFHSERMRFLNQPLPGWLTLATGHLPALAGGQDTAPRRTYLEMFTKALNNYYPARDAYGGLKQSDEGEDRSWFGVTRIYQHPEGHPPRDALTRFAPLFNNTVPPASREDLAARTAALMMAAVEHWRRDTCDGQAVQLLNEASNAGWLPNRHDASPALANAIARYREMEQRLRPERVIGGVDDWHEGTDARLALRGSYTDLGESVPRGNISFLDGPAERQYPDASGRLELAQGIASDLNPLTARVFVNRVWHYLFGHGLVRTVDDFGHLGEPPSHPELLDWLAQQFIADGWSLKRLVRLMVTSATWRMASTPAGDALALDPENRLWHHYPQRRLEAEAIRDALLAVSGRLDPSLYGDPIDPYRVSEDPTKRLYSGPLDGLGRRSLYLKMTLMEPARFLALFNQPIPKLTVGQRDVTNVPDQALALLNDPFVHAMARHWSEQVLQDGAAAPEQRLRHMFETALARRPTPEEMARLLALAETAAELRGVDTTALLHCQPVWQDLAHTLINLREFVYLR